MSDDFTPTMEYVREFYAKFQANLHMHSDYDDEAYELAEAEFDRVMAAHDAEVSEKARRDALIEAATDFEHAAAAGIEPALNLLASKLLRRRAERHVAAVRALAVTPEGEH